MFDTCGGVFIQTKRSSLVRRSYLRHDHHFAAATVAAVATVAAAAATTIFKEFEKEKGNKAIIDGSTEDGI